MKDHRNDFFFKDRYSVANIPFLSYHDKG